jgi:hypothetical protein
LRHLEKESNSKYLNFVFVHQEQDSKLDDDIKEKIDGELNLILLALLEVSFVSK